MYNMVMMWHPKQTKKNKILTFLRLRKIISRSSWERQNQGEKVGPWQGQHSGQLWQHRSLFPAPPLHPRSQCTGVLLNQRLCAAPITNDTAGLHMCWVGRKMRPFVAKKKKNIKNLPVRQLWAGSNLVHFVCNVMCCSSAGDHPALPSPASPHPPTAVDLTTDKC